MCRRNEAHLANRNSQRATRIPRNTRPIPAPLLMRILKTAVSTRSACTSFTTSSPYVEKVVNAPSRPVNKKARCSDESVTCSKSWKNNPITKQPTRLTVTVPHGKFVLDVHRKTTWRRIAPIAPPTAIAPSCCTIR